MSKLAWTTFKDADKINIIDSIVEIVGVIMKDSQHIIVPADTPGSHTLFCITVGLVSDHSLHYLLTDGQPRYIGIDINGLTIKDWEIVKSAIEVFGKQLCQ